MLRYRRLLFCRWVLEKPVQVVIDDRSTSACVRRVPLARGLRLYVVLEYWLCNNLISVFRIKLAVLASFMMKWLAGS